MKKNNAIYFLLFILLIMGAFASMAQNNYGMKIIGGVAFAFALIFIVEFISVIRKNEKNDVYTLIEPVCLFLLAFIFGLRVFYIRFPYIEMLFGAAGTLLAIIYLRKMILRYRYYQPKNNFLSTFVLIFHLSIVLFLVSLVMAPFAPKTGEVTGTIALVLLLVFIVAALFKKDLLVEGVNMSAFKMIKHFRDHSIIIVSLFLLFSLYFGFNMAGILPGVYSDEFPKVYFELVDKAASGKEKPVDGKYKYGEFKKKYDEFIKHNSIKDK
jgi:hypothetical protein